MTPEEQARVVIDKKLEQSGWTIQDMKKLNLTASLGVAVREFPTSTGPVDYALLWMEVLSELLKQRNPLPEKISQQLRVSLPVMHIAPSNGFNKTIASDLHMKLRISWCGLLIMMI